MNAPATQQIPDETTSNLKDNKSIDLMVPHITIDVHCVSKAFETVLQNASQDRHLSQTKMRIGMGGSRKAAAYYQSNHTPDLLIIESEEQGAAIFPELEAIAKVCDEGTRVIVAGSSNDISFYREMIRQGVSEYIVTPTSPMQVIDAIASIYSTPSERPVGKVIAFIGAKGGVGASTVAHNFAWITATQFHRQTSLLDLDVAFGSSSLNFNIENKSGVLDALSTTEELDEIKFKRISHSHSEYLDILASPASPADALGEVGEAISLLVDVARKLSRIVVVDLPHSWNQNTQAALRMSDEVVIVLEPELVSVRNSQQMYATLQASRPNDSPPIFIINKANMLKRPEIAQKDIEEIIGCKTSLSIPFDGTYFGEAANNGKMLMQQNAKHETALALRSFAAKINGPSLANKYEQEVKKNNMIEEIIDKISSVLPQFALGAKS